MARRILFLVFAAVLILGTAFSQDKKKDDNNDAFKTPIITDDMTIDSEQNKNWRMGQYKYSARPKNAWELGVHFGHFFIDGDVYRTIPGGFGVGLHLRRALGYVFSVRLEGTYGVATGLDPQVTDGPTLQRNPSMVAAGYTVNDAFNRNHRSTYLGGSIQGIFNVGNLLFHKERNKWNVNLILGTGFYTWTAKIDALDGNNAKYNPVFGEINTRSGRKDIKNALRDQLDGDYETEGPKKDGIFRLGDETNFLTQFIGGFGVARKISKRVNIGFEHHIILSDNDHWDGWLFRTPFDETNNADIGHYTSLRLNFNLGNFDEKTEPLYWLNPLDAPLSDLAEVKSRPKFDLTDTDGDGVIDMFDQEKDSETGCPVDTRGVVLDSDGDGVIDCRDKERYSPPGYEVDRDGVAIIPEEPDPGYVTEDDVVRIVNARPIPPAGIDEWFLPMVHFDLDKYYIKPEFYGHLHHVATVMKQHPQICVEVSGHTDNRNPNDYNRVLSYKRAQAAIDYLASNYGISRDRLKLTYGGEENPLVGGLPDHHRISRDKEQQHYMNRRVEFRVADCSMSSMGRPAGPDAGQGNPSSTRPGTKYSGNRNSGY
ncbi:MAG: OmpA family protein [Bacteroidota bacterium]